MASRAPRFELRPDGSQQYVVIKDDAPLGWVGISAIKNNLNCWRAVSASGAVSRHMTRSSAVANLTGDHSAHG